MLTRRAVARAAVSGVVAVVVALAVAGPGLAAPPPPPNPGDSEISASRADADAKAARVGELTGQLTQAEARLQELTDDVSYKMELANKARVDLETAQAEAAKALADAESAKVEADAAGKAVEDSRRDLDEFAAASYQQGSTIGSISAYFGATSPEDLLARAQLLEAVSGSSLNAMDQIERSRTEMANKDSAARAALDVANRKQAAADEAKKAADDAQAVAVLAQQNQAGQAALIRESKASVESQLAEALGAVDGLTAQRAQYDQWAADKQREDDENARRAAEAASAQQVEEEDDAPAVQAQRPQPVQSAPSGDGVEIAISRAMAYIGTRYSWGGGNYNGPTVGIRDGGVGDSYGDYYSVGFDCSGLMMYAFAGAGVYIPHYSGYQYNSGRKVPLNQAQRGDMLFWGPGGGTHVALYLGGGMMVEAPYSGSSVRVSPVRYGGIMPYATRLL
ncbi:NlpC/P60 family protein [Umezawaea endophytica]|uniref:NlpC/P60 family protein n=1 Tax=Umezawaea endophytica TaxID=1654476 RepID=A0A9X3A6E0_9PSEU|nr:NlpC/P60 family protein [Umezawaea endophytica]MCS7483283.1 NlpC/P60 family protein [Umezawaea endophytica]